MSDDDYRDQDIQVQLLQKELQTTKKLLRESQAKFNMLNTEHAKLQNQNQILEKSLKKSEQKFKEAIEKLSMEQIKTKELAYINKQLAIDVESHSQEKTEGFHKVQENFTRLKNQFQDIQSVWERQKQTIHDIIGQSMHMIRQNSKNLFENYPVSSTCIAEAIGRNLDKVINLLDAQNTKLGSDDSQQAISDMKNKLFEIEDQNNQLRRQKIELQNQLDSANQQINNLLPKYKEQIDKLQSQLKHGIQSTESQFREESQYQTRVHEQEKENLRTQISRLQSQLRESEFDRTNRSVRKNKSSEKKSDKKNRSDKKIKHEIKKLDEDIIKLQRSLEQEMGKIGRL